MNYLAAYGGAARPRIFRLDSLGQGGRMVRAEMRQILAEIQDGSFAKEWILENMTGRPVFNALKRMEEEHLIEVVGGELRGMMSWLKKK